MKSDARITVKNRIIREKTTLIKGGLSAVGEVLFQLEFQHNGIMV